jgi:hypothetical protein
MSRRRDHWQIVALAILAALPVAGMPDGALAQDKFASEASGIHQPGAGENNAAGSLLLALSKMDSPPESIPDTPTAMLMLPGDPGWSEAGSWATAPNQKAVLDTLRDITNPSNPHIFSLPYGVGNTPPSITETGLAIDLGEPPLIANGDFVYLDALDVLFALVNIEAARLAHEGDPEAPYKLVQWIRLARMIADQPLSIEKGWAIHSMRLGTVRLLDLFAQRPDLMDERGLVSLVRELSEDAIRLERILPPYADRIALHELVAATYAERRGPNPAAFAPTLAAMMSEGRSLGLFGEATYFQRLAEQQANWFDTTEKIDAIYNDWERRWTVPHYDRIWTQQMERRLIDPARFTLIEEFSPDLYPIFQDRLALRADMAGARMALSVIGYRRGKGVWPSDLAAIRPTFVDNIDIDPFHDGGDRFVKQFEILEYFVPIRDQKFGQREDPHPHAVRIFRAGEIFGALESRPPAFDTDEINRTIDQFIATVKAAGRGSGEAMFEQIADAILDQGLTRANYRQKIRNDKDKAIITALIPAATADLSRQIASATGLPSDLTDEDLQDLLAEQLRLLFDDSDFTTALGAVRRGDRIKDEVVLAGLRSSLRASSQAMINLVRKLSPSSFGPDSFEVELDSHSFIIYARGIDRRADWAREIGPGAADYLIWPPILTLLRSELRQEPQMSAWTD